MYKTIIINYCWTNNHVVTLNMEHVLVSHYPHLQVLVGGRMLDKEDEGRKSAKEGEQGKWGCS